MTYYTFIRFTIIHSWNKRFTTQYDLLHIH